MCADEVTTEASIGTRAPTDRSGTDTLAATGHAWATSP